MSDRDELVGIIATSRQRAVDAYWNSQKTCTLGQAGRVAQKACELGDQASADAVLAAGYRKPRVIETLEQLEALPEHVVIREHGGRIFERSQFLALNLAYDLTRPWFSCASDGGLRTDTIHLPATVLYAPEEAGR